MTIEAPAQGRINGAKLDRAVLKWEYEHGRRLSYSELADKVGVSVDFLYRLRRNDLAQLPIDRIQALCGFLGTSLDGLLWEDVGEFVEEG